MGYLAVGDGDDCGRPALVARRPGVLSRRIRQNLFRKAGSSAPQELDVRCADGVRETGRTIKNGRIVEFSESGHAPFLEENARYNEVLLGFLKDLR